MKQILEDHRLKERKRGIKREGESDNEIRERPNIRTRQQERDRLRYYNKEKGKPFTSGRTGQSRTVFLLGFLWKQCHRTQRMIAADHLH